MKTLFAVMLVLFVVAASGAWAKNCTKGKPCGKTCIAVTKTCRK